MNKIIEFECIQITQPIGTFYIGSISAQDLFAISYTDVRTMENRDVDQYLGIQRKLSQKRVAELQSYVQTVDATFPTSIIIAVTSENVSFDPSTGKMQIDKIPKAAKIIDGQHRIAGLEHLPHGDTFELIVTIFVDMDIEDQAIVFSTINLKQTKVSKSLAYDLYEYARTRSPQKTCHNIAKLLNTKEGSPFYGKIKILGTASESPVETLTQAAFVDRLLKHISTDPMKDRDTLKRGKKLTFSNSSEGEKLIFRDMFIKEEDAKIAKIIWNYFSVVEKRWPKAWDRPVRGIILNRTTGFAALMRFLVLCPRYNIA